MRRLKLATTAILGLSLGFWLTSNRLQACYYWCQCSTNVCDPCALSGTWGYAECEIDCHGPTCTCGGTGGGMSCQ
jgi:hypothetical protein